MYKRDNKGDIREGQSTAEQLSDNRQIFTVDCVVRHMNEGHKAK